MSRRSLHPLYALAASVTLLATTGQVTAQDKGSSSPTLHHHYQRPTHGHHITPTHAPAPPPAKAVVDAVAGNAANSEETAGVSTEAEPVEAPAKQAALAPEGHTAKAFTVTGPPSIDPGFVHFGYLQNSGVLPHIRWNSLTHIGTTFINFNSSGNFTNLSSFTNRDSSLKAGGAAENAGVKVIMVVLNDGFSSTVTNSVMQSATNRATLISNVVSAVTGDAYCQGVSFDFEPFSYGAATRDGMVQFFEDLRIAFDASSKPDAEISLYTDSVYSSSNYDLPALVPNIDYFNYSCYDWATGTTAHAVSDTNNYVTRVATYFTNGLPPEKMVLVDSSYGGDWPSMSSASYNATGGSRTSIGFTDGLFDTTLNTANGGPFTANYQSGDEVGWYAYVTGGNQHVVTWEDPRAIEYKTRLVQSFQDSGNNWNGRRLRGVGWWSLYWMANFSSSYNPLPVGSPQGVTSRTRTYTQPYQIVQEILAPPGVTKQVFEKFEQDNPRWASFASTQNSSPDNSNWLSASTTKGLVSSPTGTGAPINSTKAMDVHFAFSGSSAGKIFFRHEVLRDNNVTSIVDTNAMAAKFDQNNTVHANVYSVGAYTGLTVRLVVMDKNRQLEASPQYAMNSTGWRTLSWNLTDTSSGNINGLTTSEPAFANGNGTIDSNGAGARDIGFVGFLIEKAASGSTTGDLYFDELSYEHTNPGAKNYKINEFRNAGNANEFVEIHGPSGAFPSNLVLRTYNPTDGSVLATTSLSGQSIPANGFFVVGDPNVVVGSGATLYTPGAWTDAANNLETPTAAAGAIQLYDTVNGNVYDSVVYQANGGLGDLTRQETHGVTGEGFPWIGEVSAGGDASGVGHSMGRYPDGSDTQVNYHDFSAQRATPGASNGAQITLPAVFDFESAPSGGAPFTTFGSYAVTTPPAGISHDGNAFRNVDTTGGGTMMFIGDASLGSDGDGYNVTGDLYIQPTTARTAAQGVGFCGTQGTRFFTSSANNLRVSGYENGYWITFENNSGLSLNDGQADHAGVFHFIHASNDNMDGNRTTLLGSASLATVGLSGTGGWTDFLLYINPNAASGDQLIAKVNGVEIYHGAIPDGGPTAGAFMTGYREATGGTFASTDGTWIDNVVIASSAIPDAPSGLSATTVSQTQINLSWTDNSSNETGFIIARSTTSGGPYTDIYTTAANATSYSNTTGLSANTTYYYVVRATNSGGDSANSSQASATTLPNAPSAPSGLGATTVSQTQINLSWTDNSSNETGFIIARSTTSGGPYTDIYTTAANATSYSNTSLNTSTPYFYVVRATNTGGNSANSSQASATTLQANRITNGSFEDGFTSGVGNGWTSFTVSGSAALGFGQASVNKKDGSYSQYWNRADTSACDGGVYQTFSTTPGQTYQIDAWMKRQSTFTGTSLRVGYDLTGGTNPTAGTVTYTDITGSDNTWNSYSQSIVATGYSITVFARGGHTGTTGGSNAYFYIDACTVVGAGPSLVNNGSCEGTYTGGVASGWTSFTTAGTPTFGRASVNKWDGSYSQYWNRGDTVAFDGGVRQTISTTAGQAYIITAKMKRQSTLAGTTMRFGYDLSGGTSPTAGSVVYTDITGGTNNVWVSYSQTVVATGSSITVFARGGHTGTTGGTSSYFYVDQVTLSIP